ncbi:unnamed protein product [Ectocarpus sp. 13 AM-2016]
MDSPRSPASGTPITAWQTPWSQTIHHDEPAPPRSTNSSRQHHQPSLPSQGRRGNGSFQRERERERGQRRQHQHRQHRQASLELLEARSLNRVLEQESVLDKEEIAALCQEQEEVLQANSALQAELEEARASLTEVCREVERLSAALTKQASLLTSEKNRRRDAETELGRCKSALVAAADRCSDPSSGSSRSVDNPGATSVEDNASSMGSTDGSHSTGSSVERPVLARASAVVDGAGPIDDDPEPDLPDLFHSVQSAMTGTVSRWIKGMQAACSPGLRQALVLPWLLHKLFFLSTEVIDERRQELVSIFEEGAVGGSESTKESSVTLHDHLNRHYPTAFPLQGEKLKAAIKTVMMSLAHSMIESEEWNPEAKNADAVQSALAASGLEKIVEEYLNIAVGCLLRSYSFTDDLGDVERFDPNRHFDPVDGEVTGELCVVIFPALVGGDGVEGEGEEEAGLLLGRRFVMNYQGK